MFLGLPSDEYLTKKSSTLPQAVLLQSRLYFQAWSFAYYTHRPTWMSSCWYQLSLLRAQDPDISLHWYTYLQTAVLVVPLPISLSDSLIGWISHSPCFLLP